MEEEAATLDGQFYEFARLMDTKRDGTTITLYQSDYWMRQAKLLDDRKLTMTDTGDTWWKFCKTELNFEEWCEFLTDLCNLKEMDYPITESALINCGIPGSSQVIVPKYREFFDTYKPRSKLQF